MSQERPKKGVCAALAVYCSDSSIGNRNLPLTSVTNSELLKSKIRLVDPRLQEQLSLFWEHPRFPEVFKQHLQRLYHAVHASVPMMQCALEKSRQLAPNCPIATALVPYFSEHIEEEKQHDVWLLQDMEVLGVPPDQITEQIPPTVVATLIGTQYYYINHTHPITMIGYLAVVEGNPPRAETLDQIVAKTSIPKEALRSFYKHAELDIHHSDELWQLLDDLPLTTWHNTLLGLNVMLVTDQLANMLEELLAEISNEG
jgi:hypothetical protein